MIKLYIKFILYSSIYKPCKRKLFLSIINTKPIPVNSDLYIIIYNI